MHTRNCLAALFLFFSVNVFAQKPGYVVLNSGDTLHGYVKLLDGYLSAPLSIGLSDAKKGPAKSYTVEGCKAFGAGEDVYERATVTLDMSYLTNIDRHILYEDSTLTKTVFLRRIYKGRNIHLLKYYEGTEKGFVRTYDVKTHFFIQQGGQIQALIMKFKYAPRRQIFQFDLQRGITAVRIKYPFYRDQLKMYYDFITEKALVKKIDNSDYDEEMLLDIMPLIDKKFRPQEN
jgi:hypothetical protein